ncbi:MAG: BrnT family toxin [Marinilabiliaceae bacterium]|nr:BrnT family toxin [Marinilabiliaceae bacterium]
MTDNLIFEWDDKKRERNILEHGIDFVEAATVFDDPKVAIVPDN